MVAVGTQTLTQEILWSSISRGTGCKDGISGIQPKLGTLRVFVLKCSWVRSATKLLYKDFIAKK